TSTGSQDAQRFAMRGRPSSIARGVLRRISANAAVAGPTVRELISSLIGRVNVDGQRFSREIDAASKSAACRPFSACVVGAGLLAIYSDEVRGGWRGRLCDTTINLAD